MLGQIKPQETLPAVALQADTLALQVDTIPQPRTEEATLEEIRSGAQSERVQQAGQNLAPLVLDRVDAINMSDGFVLATHDSA